MEEQLPFGYTPVRALVYCLLALYGGSADVDMIARHLTSLGLGGATPKLAQDGIGWMRSEIPRHQAAGDMEAFCFTAFSAITRLPDNVRTRLKEFVMSNLQDFDGFAVARQVLRALGGDGSPESESSSAQSAASESSVPAAQSPRAPAKRARKAVSLPDDPLAAMLQKVVGAEYEIGEELGRGGMGAVFKARQVALDRSVAIKIILPERVRDADARARFEREAKTVARLEQHPNIIPIYHLGIGKRLCWFSMRFVDGHSLDDEYQESVGPLEIDPLLSVLGQVADALDFAHSNGVVHRDVKPANVMIEGTGRVLVSDFGLAKALQEGALTAQGDGQMGTGPFMAPEVWKGQEVSGATDQYAMGVMAFYLMTCDMPLHGESFESWGYQHVHEMPLAIRDIRSDLPEYLSRAIARSLAKKPADRFPTCRAFVEAMKDPAIGDQTPKHPQVQVGVAARAKESRKVPPTRVERPSLPSRTDPTATGPRRTEGEGLEFAAPLRAEQSGISPAQIWWLEHLGSLSDFSVESGAAVTADSRTGRHQRLWQEATQWLDDLSKAVLDRPGERWTTKPRKWQAGNLYSYYWGSLYPDTHPELGDAFHIGVTICKNVNWIVKKIDRADTTLRAQASGPLITLWASSNDKVIERLGRDDLHATDGELQHQILVNRPELWHEGGALVRTRDSLLMRPASYLDRVERGEIEPGCSLFGPLITAQEVTDDPEEAARRVAGFLTLLAGPVREVRSAAASR